MFISLRMMHSRFEIIEFWRDLTNESTVSRWIWTNDRAPLWSLPAGDVLALHVYDQLPVLHPVLNQGCRVSALLENMSSLWIYFKTMKIFHDYENISWLWKYFKTMKIFHHYENISWLWSSRPMRAKPGYVSHLEGHLLDEVTPTALKFPPGFWFA